MATDGRGAGAGADGRGWDVTTTALIFSAGVLAFVGAVEGHAFQWRYRATHGTPVQAGLSTAWVTTLRCAWGWLGASAYMRGGLVDGAVVAACYVVAASLSTTWTRAGEVGRSKWVVKPCGWPFPRGFCCYRKQDESAIDHGVTRARAQQICDWMNAGKKGLPPEHATEGGGA